MFTDLAKLFSKMAVSTYTVTENYEAYFPASSYQKYRLISTRLHTRWYLMIVLVCIFLVLSELLGGLFPPDTSDLHGQFYHLKGKQQREHQAIITVWRNSFKARWNKSFILPSFKKAGDQTGRKHSATVLTTLWLLLSVQFWSYVCRSANYSRCYFNHTG